MPTHFLEELYYPGNLIRIECYDELGKKYTYLSNVKSFELEQLVLVLQKTDPLLPDQLKSGTEVSLICQYNQEPTKYYFTSQVIDLRLSTAIILLSRPLPVQVASRRNFFRCDVNLPFTCFNDEFASEGKILNLSACGLYGTLSSNFELHPGNLVKGQMLLPTYNIPLEFDGRIIRTEPMGNRIGIALNFENVTESWQNKVIKYLFQRQRELILRGQIKFYR